MNIFLTGDRSMSMAYLPLVAVEMLRAVNEGTTLVTGTNTGVEQIVREFAERAGVQVDVIEGGKAEFDARHAALAASDTHIVVIHTDALESSMFKSILAAYASHDDHVRLVTPLDLVA